MWVFASSARDNFFDTGTPMGFNADIAVIVKQSDGKILMGGRFYYI
jgi:hypothetical protein